MKKLKLLTILALVSVVLSTGCKKDEKEAVVFPLVISAIPTDKAVDVPLNQIITATFDKKMDAATITQASFIVQQGTTAVAGTVSYSGLVASFSSSGPLISNTLYAGTIKTLVKDELGNALEADYKWSFTTIPQITLSSNPAAGGTTSGAGTFARGSAVTVTATPNTGYSFVNWTEGTEVVSPDASYTLPLNANRILVANFALNTYALNITATNGTVVKNPNLATYTSGATVQLTATPNTGYTFTSWSGDATGSTNPLPVTMTANKTITANFTAIAVTYALNVTAINGTVVKNPNLATYTSGAIVQLTATPNTGYTFTSWSGDATGSTNPLPVTMTANKTITANFTAVASGFALNITATNGTVVKNPNLAAYNSGAMVVLTATANSGYRFTSWSGDVTGSTNPLPVFMTANKNITANFVETDNKALQALIDQCPTNGTVILPAGTYYIDAVISLNLKSNMTLKMESGTILKAIPNSNTNSNIIKIWVGITNVNVEGGTLIGERASHTGTTGEWGMGIGIYSGTNITITGVTAKDCWGDGFFIGYKSNTITFDNVTADNNRRQGLSNSGGDNVVIKNSTFKNTNGTAPQYGIDIEPDAGYTANDNQIINCQFTGNKGGGIDVNGMWSTPSNPSTINNLIITGNTCSANVQRGMNIVRTTGKHHIYNNICFNNGANGINLIRTTGNNVHENEVYNNTGIGIVMDAESTGNTITGNTVYGNTTGQISEVSGNTISDNITSPPVP